MNYNTLINLLPIVLLFVLMYFLMIRPQKKKDKQIKDMRNSLTEIITIGGLCGKIVKTKDETIVVQAGADKVKFEMMRWAVSTVTKESTKRGMQDNFEDDDEPKKVMPKKLRKSSDIEEAEAKEPETKEAKVYDEE